MIQSASFEYTYPWGFIHKPSPHDYERSHQPVAVASTTRGRTESRTKALLDRRVYWNPLSTRAYGQGVGSNP